MFVKKEKIAFVVLGIFCFMSYGNVESMRRDRKKISRSISIRLVDNSICYLDDKGRLKRSLSHQINIPMIRIPLGASIIQPEGLVGAHIIQPEGLGDGIAAAENEFLKELEEAIQLEDECLEETADQK
ncbi:MAG: hypothetical protein LBB21_00695 [Holosporaceae bacterium]|jgi:hypothetical protein|nr:hypothetical protein [Holosporaceae bacterium]